MKVKKPRWGDEARVASFIWRLLDDEDLEVERQDALRDAQLFDVLPDIPLSEIHRIAEQNAIDAFEGRNDVVPLAELLDPENPFNKRQSPSLRSSLAPETWRLVSDLLTGRRKRKIGRPRTIQELRDPRLADAAIVFPRVSLILRKHWHGEEKIRERAVEIAAQRFGKSSASLANYLNKSKKNRR
jgi:hypothetical protein